MKRFLLAILAAPCIALARFETVQLTIPSLITNDVKSVTNEVRLSGRIVSLMIYASTNSTGYVNTVKGYGLSRFQGRTNFGPFEVTENPVWTNFPTPFYVDGDILHMNFRIVNTNNTGTNSATAVIVIEK